MLGISQLVLVVSGFGLVMPSNFLFHSIIRETNERLERPMRLSPQDARPKFFKIMAAHRANCPDSHLRKALWTLDAVGVACVLAAFFLNLAH
jgi:hypothetical protein